MNILEICPYEPPVSGWTMRVRLLRRVIQERGGVCEILDIGPSRKLSRPDCIPTEDGLDYLAKLLRFARRRFTFHGHVNGEYFRGLLLALAAGVIARTFRNRFVVTFHAGTTQPFLAGWRKYAVAPLFGLIFAFAHAVICNSEEVRQVLSLYAPASRIFPIPAFTAQYLEGPHVKLDERLSRFMREHAPLVSTYLCFREGFFTDVVIDGLHRLLERWPGLGLVVVGTGDGRADFERDLEARGIRARVLLAGDMEHGAFMALIAGSQVHLRTHVRDGVSATVLEALSLRVPVVASENGIRPPSVVTYRSQDAGHLAERLDWTLRNREEVARAIQAPPAADSVTAELDLLAGLGPPGRIRGRESVKAPAPQGQRE